LALAAGAARRFPPAARLRSLRSARTHAARSAPFAGPRSRWRSRLALLAPFRSRHGARGTALAGCATSRCGARGVRYVSPRRSRKNSWIA
jgi:hypothetical protein